eukprot:scaffold13221_cov100-Isochrysis_galbana.AAC.3
MRESSASNLPIIRSERSRMLASIRPPSRRSPSSSNASIRASTPASALCPRSLAACPRPSKRSACLLTAASASPATAATSARAREPAARATADASPAGPMPPGREGTPAVAVTAAAVTAATVTAGAVTAGAVTAGTVTA